MTPVALALIGWVGAAALMLVLWVWHLRIRNAGVVDVGWVASVAGLGLLYAWLAPGFGPRRWLIAAMMGAWGARLAWYLLRDRVLGQPEDRRYTDLRARASPAAALAFFPFFQAQGALAVFFSLPALMPAFNQAGTLHALEAAAAGLWLIALAGETAADRQLAAFKADPSNRGRTCRAGLWRYSRHPNYFFEWLIWVAYALFALPSPGGWLAIGCPALMLCLLFRVTGIPATEAQALRTKGDDYRVYQETTSAFVPWPPRPSGAQGAKSAM
jgi:steroid 5-alpha reductase family enzyme